MALSSSWSESEPESESKSELYAAGLGEHLSPSSRWTRFPESL